MWVPPVEVIEEDRPEPIMPVFEDEIEIVPLYAGIEEISTLGLITIMFNQPFDQSVLEERLSLRDAQGRRLADKIDENVL